MRTFVLDRGFSALRDGTTYREEELEDDYESEIHHGRLYPNLDTLIDKGLIEKGQIDRRTDVYTITQRGRRELEARREWENEYLEKEEALPA